MMRDHARDLRTRTRPHRALGLACAAALLATLGPSRATALELRALPTYRSWTLSLPGGDAKVAQFLVPLTATIDVGWNAKLTVSQAAATSTVDRSDGDLHLVGLTALSSQVSWLMPGNRALAQVGFTAPSGKRALDPEEFQVLRVIALPVLGFGTRQMGRGLELHAGVSAAATLGESGASSLGLGLIHRGEYELVLGIPDYRPASEWSATAGFDWGRDPDGSASGPKYRLDVTLRSYGDDAVAGADVFHEGRQLEAGATAQGALRGVKLQGRARGVLKASSTALGAADTTVRELQVDSGDALFFDGSAEKDLSERFAAGIQLEATRISGADSEGRNGTAIGFGPSLSAQAGALALRLEASWLMGSIDAGGSEESGLSGFAVSLGARWAFRR